MDKYPNDVHFPMATEDEWKISDRVEELENAGRFEEAEALMLTVPVLPCTAFTMKKFMGLDVLREKRVNLWLAIEKYGPEFLETP